MRGCGQISAPGKPVSIADPGLRLAVWIVWGIFVAGAALGGWAVYGMRQRAREFEQWSREQEAKDRDKG